MNWIKNKQKLDTRDWHLHFVWKPVVVHVYPDGNEKKVWLETVLRRKRVNDRALRMGFLSYDIEYKEIPTGKPTSAPKPTLECQHENGTVEKMGGRICRDCSIIMEPVVFERIQEPDQIREEECPNPEGLRDPDAMEEAFRVTMTPDKPRKHEIEKSWEAKSARRNKTIM